MAEELDIRWVDETDSTQNAFQGHIPSYDNLSVVAALSQTAGRGQRGNTWLADRPQSSYMVRTLDDCARALLSDRYRRIDNLEIAMAVLLLSGHPWPALACAVVAAGTYGLTFKSELAQ